MKFKHNGEQFNFNPDEFSKILKELENGLSSEKEIQDFINRSHIPTNGGPVYTPYRNASELSEIETNDNDVKTNGRKLNEI